MWRPPHRRAPFWSGSTIRHTARSSLTLIAHSSPRDRDHFRSPSSISASTSRFPSGCMSSPAKRATRSSVRSSTTHPASTCRLTARRGSFQKTADSPASASRRAVSAIKRNSTGARMTSMYWFSETRKPEAVDWRPEIHDSDGLALWTGMGERIWRPLNNPSRSVDSSFQDLSPRGFGLLQRDRNFDHYQDGVMYDRRPSLWVEPLDDWGAGTIQLVELPTDDEIDDNIVAMWVPAAPARTGASYRLRYRLHWLADEPYPTSLARCVASRLGNGGQPGQPRPHGLRKFMIEFLGGRLANLQSGVKPEAVLWASRGSFSYVFTEAVPDDLPGHWRAQ